MRGAAEPARFARYAPAADGRGFYLPCGRYFALDARGGWRDEFGNAYDAQGRVVEGGEEEWEGSGEELVDAEEERFAAEAACLAGEEAYLEEEAAEDEAASHLADLPVTPPQSPRVLGEKP